MINRAKYWGRFDQIFDAWYLARLIHYRRKPPNDKQSFKIKMVTGLNFPTKSEKDWHTHVWYLADLITTRCGTWSEHDKQL